MNDLDRDAGGVAPSLEDLPADRFDQCGEYHPRSGERCTHEAHHGGTCSWFTADPWPLDDFPPDPL